MNKHLLWASFAVVALGLGWVGGQFLPSPEGQRTFELVDTNGAAVRSDIAFENQGYLLTVGYTFCPDVCPTTMAYLNHVLEQSEQVHGAAPPAVFVSVDPQRDTPERLDQYVSYFGDRIVGMTGSPEQLNALKKEYSVFFQRVDGTDETDYLVDHSAGVLVLNPDHQLVGVIRDGEPLDSALATIAKAL